MIAIPEPPEGSEGNESAIVSARIKLKGIAAIDWLAELDGVDRSEEVRRLLAEAVLARKRLIAARQLGDLKRAQNPRAQGSPKP